MKTTLLILALVLFSSSLQAGIVKNFPRGYIVCEFDRPATVTNQGSKLRVGVQDPTSHRWVAVPFADDPASPRWPREFVATGTSTDEVNYDGTLTIKKPVTIVFWNFKGGEIDVEFSVPPKRIKRLSHLPHLALAGFPWASP